MIMTVDSRDLVARAIALSQGPVGGGSADGTDGAAGTDGAVDPVEALCAAAGGDRAALEAARDEVATRVHRAVDDFEATAALTLLNRALSAQPRIDPLDWRVRWTQRFRKP